MPVDDINGEKFFEGIQDSIYSAEDTSELLLNNSIFLGWLLIIVLFIAALVFVPVFISYLVKRYLH